MKKKFIPMSILAVITVSFWSLFLLFCIIAITIGFITGSITSIVGYFICIGIFIIGEIFIFLITITYKITITDNSIIMWGAGKRNKDINHDQYFCEVKFKEIISINIVPSKNDSLNKKIVGPNSIVVKEYLEFIINDGRNKRFNIFYFSKKQMRKILTIVVDKMKSLGNENYKNINIDEIIEKQWNTYQEYKRKYLKKK